MLRFVKLVVPMVLALGVSSVFAQDENPVVATVKSKVKDKDKPFGMAVIFKVKPGNEKAFEEAFKPCLVGTRKEPGNLGYFLNHDLEDPQTFIVFERFKSVAALEAHAKSPHVAELLPKIGPLLDGEAKVKVFSIAGE
ncbi:MAG: antibiotic biosynthesis monooxygenase [Planctomycetes bacterium]|nr:antibiotic biosynthesis monooxygenase [Planctomycetota bacterium]